MDNFLIATQTGGILKPFAWILGKILEIIYDGFAFFGIYNILLWPRILACFEPKSKKIMTAGVVAVYFLYFWLIVHTDSNLLPYRSWLFGGTYA